MTFPLPLALGIEGCHELMEVELSEALPADEVQRRLAAQLPAGLALRSVEVLPPQTRKPRVRSVVYEVPVPGAHAEGLAGRLAELLGARHWPVRRSRGRKPLDLRPLVESLCFEQGMLRMRLRADAQASAGARDVLCALKLDELEAEGVCIRRTAVEIE